MRKLWEFLKSASPFPESFLFYIFTVVADFASSMASNGMPDVHESNPFVRDSNMQFVLGKGIVMDTIQTTVLVIVAFFTWNALKNVNRTWAKVGISSLFVILGAARLMEAVLPNILLALHMAR